MIIAFNVFIIFRKADLLGVVFGRASLDFSPFISNFQSLSCGKTFSNVMFMTALSYNTVRVQNCRADVCFL